MNRLISSHPRPFFIFLMCLEFQELRFPVRGAGHTKERAFYLSIFNTWCLFLFLRPLFPFYHVACGLFFSKYIKSICQTPILTF